MAEPARDDAAEQNARNEEQKQGSSKQLLELHRHEILTPSLLLGFLSAYLLFIAAVGAFGVLAFYSGHLITLKIVFFICIPLLLFVPVGVTWYLRMLFPRKAAEKSAFGRRWLLDKIKQSFIGRSLARLGNRRSFRLFNLSFYTFMISLEIYTFPSHPRFSLATVALYMALSFASVILWVYEAIEVENATRIHKILDVLDILWKTATQAHGMAERSLNFIADTEPSHQEAHESIVAAIKAVDKTTRVIASTVHNPPPRMDTPSREPEENNTYDDEEDPSD